MVTPLVRFLLLMAGTLSVILGVIGIFLPVLPTTPFLLLAAACFGRSCEPCHAWLVRHRWFGGFIRNWEQYRGVTRRQRKAAIITLWAGIGLSIAFGTNVWWVRLVLAGIALGTTIYLLRLKTVET